MAGSALFLTFICIIACVQVVKTQNSRHNAYATILQDTRNEPTPDGTFGYLYKTEDGITSSARGDPNGMIHGGFSYTDPTGLRVNINYNAGARTAPGSAAPAAAAKSNYYTQPAQPVAAPRARAPAPVYREEPQYYSESSQDQYDLPPITQYRPRARPTYNRQPVDVYQQRRSRPSVVSENDIDDDYNYRG